MFIIHDIFRLHFGHYREAKALLDEAYKNTLLPEAKSIRIMTDFTGDAYRLIFEEAHESLADYEKNLHDSMQKEEWRKWYEKFKPHVSSSHREILKQIF
jgi:hypothetical protein